MEGPTRTASQQSMQMIPGISAVLKLFKSHGEFCASQPWEVIVATLTFLVCLLTITNKEMLVGSTLVLAAASEKTTIMETIVMTFVRCLAVLHCYYRFKKIHRIGSTFIMKIAASYLAFTSILYALVIVSLGAPEALSDSWFLVLLLIDMPKITRMAQFALSSSHHRRIGENLGHGMFVLAPTFTLDTIAKVLLVGMGSLTGIRRLELFAWYAIVSIMVNFLVYLTFYPASLSLALELMYCTDGRPRWNVRQIINTLPKEDGTSPVVHRVRVIATTGLVILHMICRRPLSFASAFIEGKPITYIQHLIINIEQVFGLIIILAISLKYLFSENMDEAMELRKTYIEELTKKFEEDSESEFPIQNRGKDEIDRVSNSTDEGISLSGSGGSVVGGSVGAKRAPARLLVVGSGDDSSSESAWSEVYLPDLKDQEAQTTDCLTSSSDDDNDEDDDDTTCRGTSEESKESKKKETIKRSLEECLKILKGPHPSENESPASVLNDDEIIQLVEAKQIRSHALEKVLGDMTRGVELRRKVISRQAPRYKKAFENLPYTSYNYETVMGACCESVVGYMPVPVGVVGPLKLDDKLFQIPMATTEGCLVASTNRGCSALFKCGVTSQITDDGMSRGPVVRFPSIESAKKAKDWMENPQNFAVIKSHFDSTSRFARLMRLRIRIAGRMLYLRFVAKTGDAMGMNMLSKATEFALSKLGQVFRDMQIISVSGNLCTDKKPAAINWIEGRGKSVVCEAIVPASIVETTLKTTTAALVDLNSSKNQTGSAMAGSIGGFNAHAANIVTAIFIATGQDAAQNVGSSNCITLMEPWGLEGRDLYITCTMPSIEVGTVGGGTVLPAQSACLELLGVKGPHPTSPGENSCQLARIVCAAVLAGELSLMSALAAGHLVRSHLRHNRSSVAVGQVLNFQQQEPILCSEKKLLLQIQQEEQQEEQKMEQQSK